MRRLGLVLLLFACWPAFGQADVATDVEERERRLSILFATESRTPYCGTPFSIDAGGRLKSGTREQLLWAPILPASMLGGGLESDNAAQLVNDLHNWAPLEESFVAKRGNLRVVTDVQGGEPLCGGLLKITTGYLPGAAVRGDVARLMFYLERRYSVVVDAASRSRLLQWDVQDPVDAAEAARAWRIDLTQGTSYGTPIRAMESLVAESRAQYGQRWKSGLESSGVELRKGDFTGAYHLLNSSLQHDMEDVALDILDGKPRAWDTAFGILSLHDVALRAAHPRVWGDFDEFPAKMFALALASGNEVMARRYAEWLLTFESQGFPDSDTSYPAWMLQMAEAVWQRRWPSGRELRAELGPYRGLFVAHADARSWRDAVNAAVNAYFAPSDYQGVSPRLLPVEFAALTELRRQHQVQPVSPPVHALQALTITQVPKFREGELESHMAALKQGFVKAPAIPPLHRAIRANDEAAFRAALPGADLDQQDHTGLSPLQLAAEWHRAGMVKALKSAGAKLPQDAGLALLNAARGGQRQTVELLLLAGADPNYQMAASTVDTPLMAALKTRRDKVPIVDALLRAGARPRDDQNWIALASDLARVDDAGDFEALLSRLQKVGFNITSSGLICSLALYQHPDARHFEIALKGGASVNEGIDQRAAPIFCAIDSGDLATVTWMVEKGARLDAQSVSGLVPSRFAAQEGKKLIAEYLRQAEARPR